MQTPWVQQHYTTTWFVPQPPKFQLVPPPLPPFPSQVIPPPPAPTEPPPTRYTIEEITPLIKAIVQEVFEHETTATLQFMNDDDDDDDDDEFEPSVSLVNLRLHTKVVVGQLSAENKCAICQEDHYDPMDVARTLRCNHTFHMACIDQVLEQSVKCPMCRTDVIPPSDSEEDDESEDLD